jgi:hypothetical protein
MKKVILVYTESFGECEAAFLEDGTLLDIWSCNDACWRNEYFSTFLKKVGIEIVQPNWRNEKENDLWQERIKNAVKEHWGLSDWDE